MARMLVFADLPTVPFMLAGGLTFVIICGVCVSLAVLLAGFIRRKRREFKRNRENP